MFARLGVRVALHTHRTTGTFARASIRLCSLPADRKSSQMPDSTIGFDRLQPLQVHSVLTPEIALNHVFSILNRMGNLRQLLFVQILGSDTTFNLRICEDFQCIDRTNSIDIAQGNIDPLVTRDVYTQDSRHNNYLSFNLVAVCDERSCKSHE